MREAKSPAAVNVVCRTNLLRVIALIFRTVFYWKRRIAQGQGDGQRI
jgi:hypothetical protein